MKHMARQLAWPQFWLKVMLHTAQTIHNKPLFKLAMIGCCLWIVLEAKLPVGPLDTNK